MTDIARRFSVTVTADECITDELITNMLNDWRPEFRRGTIGYYSCDRHQGYANYPTFTVALWFRNSLMHMQLAQEAGRAYRDREEHPDVRLAEWLREYTDMSFPDFAMIEDSNGDHVAESLLNYALGTVDWLELAREFMKEEGQ